MAEPTRTPRKPERPVLWIVAGPNGCGKSTFYNQTDIEGWGGSVWIINPDLLAKRISEQEHVDIVTANRWAVERMAVWLDASVEVHQTIGVESVLSTGKYRRLVRQARQRGFQIRFVYIFVQSIDEQLRRIHARERDGGHHVPDEKVAPRRARSFRQMAWFMRKADVAYAFDNSGSELKLAIEKAYGKHCVQRSRIPADMHESLKRARVI